MMDYRATGLPQDQTVFKAYMTYAKNAKGLTGETGLSEDFGIRVAQVINSTAGANPDLLALALLNTTPPTIWGLLERSFSKDLVDQMNESAQHTRTGYAYIDQASAPVKVLAMATAIAVFDEMKEKSGQLDQLAGGLQSPEALEMALPGLIQGLMPDTGLYSQLGRSLADKTGYPALEQMFSEKLEEFRFSQEEQRQKLAELGIMIMGPGMQPLGGAPADVRYPSFEETGLLDDAKVRAVYETVTNNPRVVPEDFEGALAAGKLLSDLPSKNPTTVAAALLDIGVRGLNQDDFGFLQKKIDWDVLDLLRDHSVRTVQGPQQLLAAPVEFRQIVVANLTAQMDHIREGVDEALNRFSDMQGVPGLPPGAEMPPEMKAMMQAQAMQQLSAVSGMAQRLVRPLFGQLDAPELEVAFDQKIKALSDYVSQNMPKQLPPPTPPRRKPGNDLSFD